MSSPLVASFALACALLVAAPQVALGYDVAVVRSSGPAEQALLDELDAAVLTALTDQGHQVASADAVTEALAKLGYATVETQKQADMLGASMGTSFVIVPYVSPLAGQNRIELLAYFLPDGRAETLEQIAIEGELASVVAEMLSRLVTKQGLLVTTLKPPVTPATPPALDEPGSGEDGPTDDEKLLEKLDEVADAGQPEPPAVKKPGLGDPFRLHVVLMGGYTVLLNEPASGGSSYRHGGQLSATIGYVVLAKIGLEVAGDFHVYMGRSGVGFGLTATTGVHIPVARRLLAGARLGLGFFKGATGSQRASFLVTVSPTIEVILHDRVFLRLALPEITVLAGGDKDVPGVGILGFNLGIGARF